MKTDSGTPQGCHRSHPHELMDATCERFTKYEREAAQLRIQCEAHSQDANRFMLQAMQLRADNEALAVAMRGLLQDIDLLEGVELCRDMPVHEAQECWNQAVSEARKALAAHAAKGAK